MHLCLHERQLVATAGAVGCTLGSLVAYEIGHYGGRPLVERYGRWIPDADGGRELAKIEAFYTPKSPARRKPGAAN